MSTKKRAAVIYFPGRVDSKKLSAAVEMTVLPLGWEPTLWLPTSENETGGVQVLRALAQGATRLLIVGGDGTVRECLEAISKTEDYDTRRVTVGIVPAGTGNVLARNLRLDLTDLRRSVIRGLTGNRHPIDLGLARVIKDDGTRAELIFSVMGGVGLDAKIFAKTDPRLKKAIGWFAYVEGGLRSLPTLFENLRVQVDNREPRHVKVVSLLIGNAGWLPGNLSLMPDARLDDGRLDVAAIGPRRFWNWIGFWGRVTWGNQLLRLSRVGKQLLDASANVKTIENLSGTKIRVTPDRPVHMQIDGDSIGMIREVEFEVQPRAIVMRL